jgi:rubrerythrin
VTRYTELAEMMETHNNTEVAELFRKMAQYEAHHAAQILDDMDWAEDEFAPHGAVAWDTPEPPESVPVDEMHYLMHPWHALKLALAAEQRAVSFFDRLVREASSDDIRRAATAMRDEELEHVALVQAWLQKVPQPGAEWAVDPDPPRHAE